MLPDLFRYLGYTEWNTIFISISRYTRVMTSVCRQEVILARNS